MTMTKKQYLNLLVNEFHSATMATIGADGHPVTRIIDLMLWDESGVYFLTAKGKSLYTQLMEQKFIALSATAEKRAISLRGKIKKYTNRQITSPTKSPHQHNLFQTPLLTPPLNPAACYPSPPTAPPQQNPPLTTSIPPPPSYTNHHPPNHPSLPFHLPPTAPTFQFIRNL